MFTAVTKHARTVRSFLPAMKLFVALIAAVILGMGSMAIFAQGADRVDLELETVPLNPANAEPFAEDGPEPSAPNLNTHYQRISASTFQPYSHGNEWTYRAGGCRAQLGSWDVYDHALQLPEGAMLDQVRLFFTDDDPDYDIGLRLFAMDLRGNSQTLVWENSSGTPGQTTMAGDINPPWIVDNHGWSLVARYEYGGSTGDDSQICGIEVRYQYGSTVNLPAAFNGAIP